MVPFRLALVIDQIFLTSTHTEKSIVRSVPFKMDGFSWLSYSIVDSVLCTLEIMWVRFIACGNGQKPPSKILATPLVNALLKYY